jgi:hypothetical protein
MMPLANSGRVIINTTPPRVVGASSYAGKGRVVYFRDDLSGMDQPTRGATICAGPLPHERGGRNWDGFRGSMDEIRARRRVLAYDQLPLMA